MFQKRLRIIVLAIVAIAFVGALGASHAQAESSHRTHIRVALHPVGQSEVRGHVALQQLQPSGTHISVIATNLERGKSYVSLYYSNHVCALEPYSPQDVIGGTYMAGRHEVGRTEGNANDNLADINSVSVRDAKTFNLLACADVHGHDDE